MLTKNETQRLSELLRKVEGQHEELPKNVFHALLKVVPFIACEVAVKNDKGEILLTERNDRYWKGWHIPGGLLRYKESFEERIQFVAKNELGIHVDSIRFLGPVNHTDDKRGHAVSLVFVCTTPDKPSHGKWFKESPKNIIEHHKEIFDLALSA